VVKTMLTQDVHGAAVRAPSAGEGSVRRVLVAFDGSPGAWAALERGISLAASNNALLAIAAVVQEPRFLWQGPGAMSMPYTRESIRHDLELEMLRHLANARDEVPAAVSVTTKVLYGRAARALAAFAEEGGYDLVVTGPRPESRLSRMFRKSVTHELLTRSPTSVLAVKAA
jgi:nucleotide-binding universal stress UspA family protein